VVGVKFNPIIVDSIQEVSATMATCKNGLNTCFLENYVADVADVAVIFL
jgi:hypothetical protein